MMKRAKQSKFTSVWALRGVSSPKGNRLGVTAHPKSKRPITLPVLKFMEERK